MSALQQASSFIQVLQERQGLMVACLEEIAWHRGWISSEQVRAIAAPMINGYGRYLLQLITVESNPE
jgi:glucose-1-phosphate thymidylyltransferase